MLGGEKIDNNLLDDEHPVFMIYTQDSNDYCDDYWHEDNIGTFG